MLYGWLLQNELPTGGATIIFADGIFRQMPDYPVPRFIVAAPNGREPARRFGRYIRCRGYEYEMAVVDPENSSLHLTGRIATLHYTQPIGQ
ncbi:hypothetical protein KCP77_19880 [Salmonella enterica subsp. enterica]|nr:hypothetical protein KCP77_19880 [Salmonella enterica subsp. enterica]